MVILITFENKNFINDWFKIKIIFLKNVNPYKNFIFNVKSLIKKFTAFFTNKTIIFFLNYL